MDSYLYQWYGGTVLCISNIECMVSLEQEGCIEVKIRGSKSSSYTCFYFLEEILHCINLVKFSRVTYLPTVTVRYNNIVYRLIRFWLKRVLGWKSSKNTSVLRICRNITPSRMVIAWMMCSIRSEKNQTSSHGSPTRWRGKKNAFWIWLLLDAIRWVNYTCMGDDYWGAVALKRSMKCKTNC